MKYSALPVEFATLEGKVNYVQQISRDEYSSSCPQCGGEPHRGGEPPDRFRLFLNAHGKNRIMGWCRRCSYVWFPDTSRPLSRDEMEAWRKEQLQREEERKRSAERAIEILTSQKIWMKYHEMLNEWGFTVLKERGIREDWVRFWRLGLFPDYKVYSKKNGEYFSPAITIPLWQQSERVPANVKLRVLNPKDKNDRYRALYKVNPGAPFVAFPGMKSDMVVLTEGEFKAMNVAEWSGQKYQVVGLPTKTPNAEVLAKFANYGKIVLCFDPDAQEDELKRVVKILGRDVMNVRLPDKVDDMILKGMRFDNAMKYATKMEA